MITDPWTVPASGRSSLPAAPLQSSNHDDDDDAGSNALRDAFEDNFQPTNDDEVNEAALPDSAEYLANLERKLHRLRSDSGYLQQLTARRQHCVERLLRGDIDLPTAAELGYDEHVDNGPANTEPSVGDLLRRHLRPEQAIGAAELLQLLHYDQLQAASNTDDDNTPAEETQAEQQPQPDNVSR